MKQTINKSVLRVSIAFITVLLVANIFATLRNNAIIKENKLLQKQAEEVRSTVSQFAIVIIHNLDLGLRGYAVWKKDKYLYPMKFALRDKDSLLNVVEGSLRQQGFELTDFRQLRDSINAYADQCVRMLELFKAGQLREFDSLADRDKGYHLWLQYERFSRKVYVFEDDINQKAELRYQEALRNNYLIQILLLLICVPTLIVTAVHTNRKFSVEVKLREVETEKTELLRSQNRILEQTVEERTKEIQDKNRMLQTQNEEIVAQNEEITAQNDDLHRHREELAVRNKQLTKSKREQLELYKQNLMEKSEMINKISSELEILKNKFSPDQEHIEKFNRILHFNILTDEDWERFKSTFQEVYPTFFAGIRFRFPAITASELRLSALIKMNLSMKEAGDMLGISTDSVKKSRYRLKKRLGLRDEESLEAFIQSLT